MTHRRFVDVTPDYVPSELVIVKEPIVDDIYVLVDKISKYEYFAVYYLSTSKAPVILEGENYIFAEPSVYVLNAAKDEALHDHLRLKASQY